MLVVFFVQLGWCLGFEVYSGFGVWGVIQVGIGVEEVVFLVIGGIGQG